MSREEIIEKLRAIACTVNESLRDRASCIQEDSELLRDLGFSSFDILYMAVLLEETFHIEVEDMEEIRIKTIRDAVDLVEKKTDSRRNT